MMQVGSFLTLVSGFLALPILAGSTPYPTDLPLDITAGQDVTQIKPSVTGTTFTCPDTTRKNLTLDQLQVAMSDFIYLLYTAKNPEKALKRYAAAEYIQHNPTLGDGRDVAITGLTALLVNSTTQVEVRRIRTATLLRLKFLLLLPDRTSHSRTGVHDDPLSSSFPGVAQNDCL